MAICGVTVGSVETDSYYYDEEWGAYIYTASDETTFGYKPDEGKMLILSGDYVGEYEAAGN